MTLVSKNRDQSASVMASNGLGSKMPRLLTQDVGLARPRHQRRNALGDRQVCRNAIDLGVWRRRGEARKRRVYTLLAASVEHDGGACRRKPLSDRKPYARCRARNDGVLAGKIDDHDGSRSFGQLPSAA